MVKIGNASFSDAVHVIPIDALSIQQELIRNDMKNIPFCNNIHMFPAYCVKVLASLKNNRSAHHY